MKKPAFISILVFLLVVASILPVISQDAESPLVNADFEAEFTERGDDAVVAEGWESWYLGSENQRPAFYSASDDRAVSGSAQAYSSYLSTHVAGLYQTVGGVETGQNATFTANVYVWSTRDASSTDTSVDPGNVGVQVGIDPEGGSDPESTSIVWSDPVQTYDEYVEHQISAPTSAENLTVFVRSEVELARLETHVFVDDANLTISESDSGGDVVDNGDSGDSGDATEVAAVSTDEPDASGDDTEDPTNTPMVVIVTTTPAGDGATDAGDTGDGSTDAGDTGDGSTDAGDTGDGSTDAGDTGDGSTDAGDTGDGSTDAGDTGDGSTDAGDTGDGSTDAGDTGDGSTDTGDTGDGTTDAGDTGDGATDAGDTGDGATDAGDTGDGATDAGDTGEGSTDAGDMGDGSTDAGDTGDGSTDAGDGATDAGDAGVVEPTATVIPTLTPIGNDTTADTEADQEPEATPTIDPDVLAPYPEQIEHTIVYGDSLYTIAARYGSSMDAITAANGIQLDTVIYPGQTLIVPVQEGGGTPATGGDQPAPTPIAPAGGGAGQPANTQIYTVTYGDSLTTIAARYNTTISQLVQLNGITNPNTIRVGQQLYVPVQPPTQAPEPTATIVARDTYTVQYGDSLYLIALKYDSTISALAQANNIQNINRIYPGQKLIIP